MNDCTSTAFNLTKVTVLVVSFTKAMSVHSENLNKTAIRIVVWEVIDNRSTMLIKTVICDFIDLALKVASAGLKWTCDATRIVTKSVYEIRNKVCIERTRTHFLVECIHLLA